MALLDNDQRIQWGSSNVAFIEGNDNEKLVFGVASERMRIDSSGRVGIGTTSPTSAGSYTKFLQISDANSASVAISRSASGTAHTLELGAFSGASLIESTGATSLRFKTNSSERMRIDSSGNVGIGTTSPARNLEVKGASGDPVHFKLEGDPSDYARIMFADGTDDNIGEIRYNFGSDFMSFTANAAERMRIDSSGRLLVGQTSGSSPLCVSGTDPVIAELHHSDGGTNDQARISLGALANNPPSNRGVNLIAENNGAGHDFVVACSASHSAGPSEKMRINSAGQVLVGTTSSNSVSAALVSAVGSVPSYYANPAGLSVTTGNNANAHCVEFFQGRFDKRVLTLSSNYDQSVTFQVFEQADVNVGIITGNGSTTNFNTNPSDRSLKKNFESWDENVLSLFKNINPQKFNYLQENDGDKKSKGFIAQEMLDSFPEAYPLVEHENDKYYFNPSGMVVYLMKAIQELEAKVAALESA